MARLFDGTNDNVRSNVSGVSGIDNTAHGLSCWVYVTANPAGEQVIVDMSTDFSAATNFRTRFSAQPGTGSTVNFQLTVQRATTNYSHLSTNNYALDTWHHLSANINRGDFSRTVFNVNGALPGGTPTTGSGTAGTGMDSVSIGESAGATLDFAGTIAEVAIYASGLAANERAGLSKGASPLLIGGTTGSVSLQVYLPLWGFDSTAEQDIRRGLTFTNTGSVQSSVWPPIVSPIPFLGMGFSQHDILPMHILRRRREQAA